MNSKTYYNLLVCIIIISLLISNIYIYYNYYMTTSKSIKAIAVFTGDIKGTVKFAEDGNRIRIDAVRFGVQAFARMIRRHDYLELEIRRERR